MLETTLPQVQVNSEQRASPRVYRPEAAPLHLADGSPLYLDWVIESEDGALYRVPAERGGWLYRRPYERQRNRLTVVSSKEASMIMWLTGADSVCEAGPTWARYSFEHYQP